MMRTKFIAFSLCLAILLAGNMSSVKNGMNSELKELPDYLEKRPVFEAKA